MPTLKQIVKRGLQLYPNSKSMRKQWVRNTVHLNQTGRAGLNNGGWRAGTRSQVLSTRLVA